jgi:hypothetical protein
VLADYSNGVKFDPILVYTVAPETDDPEGKSATAFEYRICLHAFPILQAIQDTGYSYFVSALQPRPVTMTTRLKPTTSGLAPPLLHFRSVRIRLPVDKVSVHAGKVAVSHVVGDDNYDVGPLMHRGCAGADAAKIGPRRPHARATPR